MLPQLSRSLSLYNGDLSNDTISIGWRETQRSVSWPIDVEVLFI